MVSSNSSKQPSPGADQSSLDELLGLLRRTFASLLPAPASIARVEAKAVTATRDLLRRARRRRADFDLQLREADDAYTEDLALALKVQQGSVKAFDAMRERLQPVIIKRIYVYGLGWNEEQLFELVFDRVVDKLPTYRGKAALRSWCGRLASNTLKNWMRDEGRRPRSVSIDDAAPEVATAVEAPDATMLAEERGEELRSLTLDVVAVARQALSEEDWELLQRLIIDEESYAALSTESGKSQGALRKRRFDVIRKLRNAIRQRHGSSFESRLRSVLPVGDA